jgi:hypothetical protein
MSGHKILASQIFFIIIGVIVSFLLGASTSVVLLQAQNSISVKTIVPESFSFSKDLFFGQENDDIYWLQVILNRDSRTQIALVGAGSPGQESRYYGALTRDAVARFDRVYLGTLAPDGVKVSGLLREKLQELIRNTTSTPQIGQSLPILPEPNSAVSNTETLRVYAAMPYQATLGETITIHGTGFESKNKVIIGKFTIDDAPSFDGQTIVLASTTLSSGDYTVIVENTKGSSVVSGQDIHLLVSKNPKDIPHIESYYPTLVGAKDTVTITGKYFSVKKNKLVSLYGEITNLPSSKNGTEITFPVEKLQNQINQLLKTEIPPEGSLLPVSLYILTPDGVSQTALTLQIQL